MLAAAAAALPLLGGRLREAQAGRSQAANDSSALEGTQLFAISSNLQEASRQASKLCHGSSTCRKKSCINFANGRMPCHHPLLAGLFDSHLSHAAFLFHVGYPAALTSADGLLICYCGVTGPGMGIILIAAQHWQLHAHSLLSRAGMACPRACPGHQQHFYRCTASDCTGGWADVGHTCLACLLGMAVKPTCQPRPHVCLRQEQTQMLRIHAIFRLNICPLARFCMYCNVQSTLSLSA